MIISIKADAETPAKTSLVAIAGATKRKVVVNSPHVLVLLVGSRGTVDHDRLTLLVASGDRIQQRGCSTRSKSASCHTSSSQGYHCLHIASTPIALVCPFLSLSRL